MCFLYACVRLDSRCPLGHGSQWSITLLYGASLGSSSLRIQEAEKALQCALKSSRPAPPAVRRGYEAFLLMNFPSFLVDPNSLASRPGLVASPQETISV